MNTTRRRAHKGLLLEPMDIKTDRYGFVYAPKQNGQVPYDPFKRHPLIEDNGSNPRFPLRRPSLEAALRRIDQTSAVAVARFVDRTRSNLLFTLTRESAQYCAMLHVRTFTKYPSDFRVSDVQISNRRAGIATKCSANEAQLTDCWRREPTLREWVAKGLASS